MSNARNWWYSCRNTQLWSPLFCWYVANLNNGICSGRRHPDQLGCGINYGSRSEVTCLKLWNWLSIFRYANKLWRICLQVTQVAAGDSITKRYTDIQVPSAELGRGLCEGYGLCVLGTESLSHFGKNCFPATGLWFLIMYEVLVSSVVRMNIWMNILWMN